MEDSKEGQEWVGIWTQSTEPCVKVSDLEVREPRLWDTRLNAKPLSS